jgi:hypothetical protein
MGLTRIRAEQISDIDYKQAVRVITLTDIALAGEAPNQVDGVNLVVNDRVLVAGNDPASENGLYFVQTVGAGSNGTWVRSSDGNTTGEIEAGMIVMVTEGTVYKDTQWKLSTNNPIVVGTTSLVFELNNSGESGSSISNGTSSVSVPVSNGNVTISVGGTANVLTVGSNSASITGSLTATGNVSVGNVIIANNGANGITLYQSDGTTKATNTTGVILALGDSWIGGGYMANSTTVWANVASRAFQATIVNQAVGGRLSADVLANLTADVAAAGGYNNINCAVINVGGNDKLQDPAANIAQYNTTLYNNLTSILNVLTGNGVPVILSPAPDFDRDDFYITGIAPDYAAPINTGQYVDDPQYAVIANNYQGVTVSTNSMSYLFNHPAEFLIPGGFHPTLTQGQQCFVDIIASAGQGLNQNSLNAAMTMSFDLIGFNQGIELGTTTLASTPFIDFHSSGNSTVDYDSRIIGSGGSGNSGTGNINFFTNNANVYGNILSSGLITANGNVTGSYILGNGSQLTGIVATSSYGNANVVANLSALASNPISTTGNITAGYFIGNGSQLTGLPASYSNANVATFMAAYGSNTISTTGNITAGNATLKNTVFNDTGSITLPVGNTAQRPASPTEGMIRYNSTLKYPEWYSTDLSAWYPFYQSAQLEVTYLVVAGGGGGGGTGVNGGGGGGGGGYLTSTKTLSPLTNYPITVGGAGASGTYGANGTNSVFSDITSIGGGGGGGAGTAFPRGQVGGSGGGAGRDANNVAGAAGTVNQGYAGGGALATCAAAGGGGGAGGVGYSGGTDCGAARTGTLSQGGPGLQWSNSSYYAGGGGGAWENISVNLPPGGIGGGGAGGSGAGTAPVAGTTNTGGGGGGGQNSVPGANGGSGIVIITYAGTPRATGGTITQSGGVTTHTFTASGTLATTA